MALVEIIEIAGIIAAAIAAVGGLRAVATRLLRRKRESDEAPSSAGKGARPGAPPASPIPPAARRRAARARKESIERRAAERRAEHEAADLTSYEAAELRHSAESEPDAPIWRRRPEARYANVALRNAAGQPPRTGFFGDVVTVEVRIGALRDDSDVVDPEPFPDDVLPREDLVLDVLFSSADLAVGATEETLGTAGAVEARLHLPADGGPARTDDGADVLRFAMRLPADAGLARARLSYLYNNVTVQSQRLDVRAQAIIGLDTVDASFRAEVRTDFTLSRRIDADLAELQPHNRVTVIMNETGTRHHVTVRAAAEDGTVLAPPAAFTLSDGIAKHTERLREALHDIAPRQIDRRRAELIGDLRRLAPLGYALYTSLPPGVQNAIQEADAQDHPSVLQVVLPEGSTFTLPWNLVYHIYLDSSTPPQDVPVCPSVAEWDGRAKLFTGEPHVCPRLHDVDHTENLLCPFGFWGMRNGLEVLTSTDSPKHTVSLGTDARMVVGRAIGNGIDGDALQGHIDALGRLLRSAGGETAVVETVDTKAGLRDALNADLPFLYFLCHGDADAEATTRLLTIGRRDTISPGDIIGWIDVAWRKTMRRMWTDPQPLVFINACASLSISPDDLVDYLGAFAGKANASGVIGTEARVSQSLAGPVAERFFAEFLKPGTTMDAALHRTKLGFLEQGNLIGLVYTAYALADLRVAAPAL